MENNPKRNIYYTFCHIIFFFYLQRVLLLRLGLFSIVGISDFFRRKKFPIMLFYLFIFAVTIKCILTCGISLDSEK
jgi:hypothetical protein